MREKKKNRVLIVLLWIAFIAIIFIVCYLSFQSGEDTKKVGRRLIQYVAEWKYKGAEVSEEEMWDLIYKVRQTGRVIAFFLMGILGTLTIHITFQRWNWVIRTGIIASILFTVACLTEKLKIYIPDRHYSFQEMMFSIIAVTTGFLFVSLIMILFYIIKSLFKWLLTVFS